MTSIDIERWVVPFYLNILHGNYATHVLNEDEKRIFHQQVEAALAEITPQLTSILISGHWRESITGSWFAGLKNYTECQIQIAKLLLASKTCYAGQSHAFAMACFANKTSVIALRKYLDRYLRRKNCYYDQDWAMPALMWIDKINSTDYASEYLKKGGLWDSFVKDKKEEPDVWTIESCKSHFWDVMNYCAKNFNLGIDST